MADGYSWREQRGGATYRLPGPEHLGWWAAVAMLLSILLHVVVFFALDRMKIAIGFDQAKELSTQPINIQQVEVRPIEPEQTLPPEDIIKPPTDAAKLMEDIELLAELPKNPEIDIKPDVTQAQYELRMQKPAMAGDPGAIALEAASGLEMNADLPELGREPTNIRPAEIGQITVDPGSPQVDDLNLGKFTDDLIKKGANGKVENGALDGIKSLDELLDLPANILLSKKTMLPSDLLFEFNSSELRESAKVGLMKLALLMDRNPGLYCWIEGHTDLVGGDEFNLELSIKRAESVKQYLVKSMRMDASKIITRGFGRYEPLVITGTTEEQGVNRRVEIRMRKTPPTSEQRIIAPQKAAVIEEAPPEEAPAPKAVLVKPKRALPVEEAPPEPTPPKAKPIEPPPAPPVLRASPVEIEEQIPRAQEIPKAQPIEE
ncbi:MAG: OmpA family protein [Luteolibacter sp.]